MNAIEEKHQDKHNQFVNVNAFGLHGKVHATITKDTSIGFLRFARDGGFYTYDDNGVTMYANHESFYTESELYDIYVKSLEG